LTSNENSNFSRHPTKKRKKLFCSAFDGISRSAGGFFRSGQRISCLLRGSVNSLVGLFL